MIRVNENTTTIVMENTNTNQIVAFQQSIIGILQYCCLSSDLDNIMGCYMHDCLNLLGNLLPEFTQQQIALSTDEDDIYFRIPKCLTERQKKAILLSLNAFDSPVCEETANHPIVKAIELYK